MKIKIKWRLRLNANTLIIYTLKTQEEQIECRPYMQFHVTAKCFKSTLYLPCYWLKNCHLVLFSVFCVFCPFTFCHYDWQIAILLAPGHNRVASLVSFPWTVRSTYVLGIRWRNMVAKLCTDRGCETLW